MPNHSDDLWGTPITAAVNRSELVKKQLRDRKGRWVEMGAEAKVFLHDGSFLNGTVSGIKGEYATLSDVKKPDGTPHAGELDVHYTELEMISEKADLDDIGEPGPATSNPTMDQVAKLDIHTKPGDPDTRLKDGGAELDNSDFGFDKPEDWEFLGQMEDPNGDDSFAFNTAILALTINIGATLIVH